MRRRTVPAPLGLGFIADLGCRLAFKFPIERGRVGPDRGQTKDLSISESCLRNWMAQADADGGGRADRLSSAEKKELARLRRRNRQLEMEDEILKRAAAYFAKENVLPK
jgi:transposase